MLITTILLLCLGQAPPAAQPPPTTPSPEMTDTQRETVARALLADLVAGRYEDASRNFDAAMRSGLPPASLASFAKQLEAKAGKFEKVREVRHLTEQGYKVVLLVADYEQARLDVRVVFDHEGKVGGLFFKPSGGTPPVAAPTRFADYVTKTPLHLPFDGDWFVFWGGRTIEENYHVISVDQRFAYDFLVVRDGTSHRPDAKDNSGYYCWDSPIYAPAEGVVTESVDGIEDNVPGVMNRAAPAGNHVVIDHGNGEYSLLAHFRRGTVTVHVGDHVKAGALIGHSGNSGNSSEPHLHYHLQNGPHFGSGEGLPAPFRDYCADGKPLASGEPRRGQHINKSCGK